MWSRANTKKVFIILSKASCDIGGYLFSGLVCVSPGTDTYHPATVLAISATLTPLLHVGSRNVLLRLTEIDDPLDVFATHLVPGIVGLGLYSKSYAVTQVLGIWAESESELLTIMIATRFLDSIVGNNQFQSIFGSINHNSMIVT